MTSRTTLNIIDLGVRQGLSHRSRVANVEYDNSKERVWVSPAFEQSKTALSR